MPTGGCTLQPGSEPSRTGDFKSQSLNHSPMPRWPEPSHTDPLAVKTRAFRKYSERGANPPSLFWGSGVGVFFSFLFFLLEGGGVCWGVWGGWPCRRSRRESGAAAQI